MHPGKLKKRKRKKKSQNLRAQDGTPRKGRSISPPERCVSRPGKRTDSTPAGSPPRRPPRPRIPAAAGTPALPGPHAASEVGRGNQQPHRPPEESGSRGGGRESHRGAFRPHLTTAAARRGAGSPGKPRPAGAPPPLRSPSGPTALRSASAAAATAARAVPPRPASPSSPRAPPLSPLPTGARLTSHPAEGGGKGERPGSGQSPAGDPRPRPCRAGGAGAALDQPREPGAGLWGGCALGPGGRVAGLGRAVRGLRASVLPARPTEPRDGARRGKTQLLLGVTLYCPGIRLATNVQLGHLMSCHRRPWPPLLS